MLYLRTIINKTEEQRYAIEDKGERRADERRRRFKVTAGEFVIRFPIVSVRSHRHVRVFRALHPRGPAVLAEGDRRHHPGGAASHENVSPYFTARPIRFSISARPLQHVLRGQALQNIVLVLAALLLRRHAVPLGVRVERLHE